MTPEFSLLLTCARPLATRKEEAAIRQILGSGIDWTVFTQTAITCRLAGLAGHTMGRLVPDLVPPDVLDALRFYRDQVRARNRELLHELVQVIEVLADSGIEAIPFKGPILALQAYGDLGLSEFNDIDLLVHDSDMASTMAAFLDLGYERYITSTKPQAELIQRFQGNDTVFKKHPRRVFRIHGRLTARNMAFDIDYDAMWRRALKKNLTGHVLRALTPEDTLVVLAIQGGQNQWRNIRWVCDVAALASACPQLNWNTISERARSQGCLRIVWLATSLAETFFDAAVPNSIAITGNADPAIKRMADRMAARWRNDEKFSPAADTVSILYRMRLHDGAMRRTRFLVKAVLVPDPHRAALTPQRATPPLPTDQKSSHLDPEPQDANAWARQADDLLKLARFAEATEASDRALALSPQHIAATRIGIDARIFSCDWHRREEDKRLIGEGLKAGARLVGPLNHRAICSSEAEHLIFAQLRAKEILPADNPQRHSSAYRHDKIRIAYISTDFRDHVLSAAMAGCFEQHDKRHFEITAISTGADDGSQMRQRIKSAVDRFIDVQNLSDAEVAAKLRELEIDIAVDQNGYSGAGRTGILASRPAPVQVNYLAYPGTLGVPFIDYIIADRFIIPDGNRRFYSEQVAYLPHTYLPTDSKRPIADRTPSRSEAGLPQTGFVFVCNNNAHKIGPEIFDIWMRLLIEVEDSVIWLGCLSPSTRINLRREAGARGVAAERLVFAPKMPNIEDHLARLRLGDLFLDTLPYNAHATASDALWTGLPVLTCHGNTFPAGVAAGVVHAIGLPELITKSLAEYEELALTLARNPERLGSIKAQLMRNRTCEPLFNTALFTRNLESAYRTMFERHQAGLPPESFAVASA
jgi:predicted O-linked N-acetylglucosamine transferase (SPINDLY family)